MNTETRVRGVHSSCPGGYTQNDAEDGPSLEVDAPVEIDIETASAES